MKIFDGGVEPLGFDLAKMQVRFNKKTNTVENYLVVDEVPSLLEDSGLVKGDQIVLFTSRKPTRDYFVKCVDPFFEGKYIFGNGMMGFVGKKK